LHPHHPRVASGTHAVPVVWTSMATYFDGHPVPRADRQCTRPGREAELLGGRPTLVCTHVTRLSRRGRTPYPWFALLWPHTSMATQFRARTASARGPVGMRNCRGDARHWFAPTPPACRVGDARRTRGLDFNGHILLWPPNPARTASARGPVGMRNCWGAARHWFAPSPPACRVGDARRTRGLDFYGHILLWPPNSAHGPPVHAAL